MLLVLGLVATSMAGYATEADDFLTSALEQEAAGNYSEAITQYQQYFATQPTRSAERRHARIKLPVLQEAVTHGYDSDLLLYLSALDARADADIDSATGFLDQIETQFPNGRLVDDAMYFRAYIAMMDTYSFQTAYDTLESLRQLYPDSRYYDTALYSGAIAQEQLGDPQLAVTLLTELQARHTGGSLAALSWPRDEYMSRLWYDRAQRRIDHLQNHQQNASNLISMEPHDQDGFEWRALISNDGVDMVLLLNKSPVTDSIRILSDSGTPLQLIENTAFAGQVEGEPDSWARVTLTDNDLRGAVSVYGERIQLKPQQTGGTLSDFYPLLLGDIDGYQAPDSDQAFHPPQAQNSFDDYVRAIKVSSTVFNGGTVGSVMPIGVVIDTKYNDYHGGRGVEEALSILNSSDGIFRDEFGLAIIIDTLVVIEDRNNDPMNLGSVTMESMMRNFRDYRRASTELGSDVGLATLFSGNKNSDAALGLAWIGSACRTDGYDVSVVTPYRLPELLSTHEIAHSLGAPHDTDTACSAETTHLMWPYLSDKTQSTFSSCSKDSVEQVLSRGGCLIDAMDLSVELDVEQDSVDVTVANLDTTRITSGASVTVAGGSIATSSYPSNCSSHTDGVSCDIAEMPPSSSSSFSLLMNTALTAEDTVVASVEPIGFMDVETNNNSVSNDINGNRIQLPGGDSSRTTSSYTPTFTATATGQSASGAMMPVDLLLLLAIGFLSLPVGTQNFRKRGKGVRVQVIDRTW